jgi:hypothetical protein
LIVPGEPHAFVPGKWGTRIHVRDAVALVAAVTLLSGAAEGQRSDTAFTLFTDITREAGIDFTNINGASADKHLVETMGSGGLFFDYDNDGYPDIFLVDGGSLADPTAAAKARHRLYHNLHNGTFADVTESSGIRHREYGMGACAADYDNDGYVDLYVTNYGANTLYRNRHDGSFQDVTRTAGVGAPLWSTSCAFADFDRDGYVDLFITNYVNASPEHPPFCGNAQLKIRTYCHPLNFQPLTNLVYHNNGNGTFTDVTSSLGLANFRGNGLGVVVADLDDDEWPDVFVANDTMPNFLFMNERGKRFVETGLSAGVAVATDGTPRAGMGTDAGDYDSDGKLDLIVTNLDLETHSLFRNLGGRLFAYMTPQVGLSAPTRQFVGFGVAWIDYDNDGAPDLAMTNGHVLDKTELLRAGSRYAQRSQLFHNVGGRFVETGRGPGSPFDVERVGRGLAAGDIDNDGDLDLLMTVNGGRAVLLRNDIGQSQNALLVQTIGKASNRDGIGARLKLTAGGRTQIREIKSGSSYLSQNDMRAHFGLARASVVDRLEIRWPNGRTEVIEKIPAGQIITVREGEGIVQRNPYGVLRPTSAGR